MQIATIHYKKKFTTEIHSVTVTEWLAQIKRHFTFFACNK